MGDIDFQAMEFAYEKHADQTAADPARHQVVVVGAGPVGLTTALDLARQISAFPQLCMRGDRMSAIEQWSLDWDAAPGDHTIEVRATDAAGRTQTEQRTPVAPDGATGWHTISVHVA